MILNTSVKSVGALAATAVLVVACASSPPEKTHVVSHEGHTVVEVIPPGASGRPERRSAELPYGQRIERFLIDWLSKNRDAVDDCYMAEALYRVPEDLSKYEFQVIILSNLDSPLVRMLSASQPDQELLGYCVKMALARLRFPRGFEAIALKVPIEQPVDLY